MAANEKQTNKGDEGRLPGPLSRLEDAVLGACSAQDPWPAQVAAGVYAGVDFVIANPDLSQAWLADMARDSEYGSQYERIIGRLTSFIKQRAPVDARLPVSSDEALVAGIVGLVGDHVRIGRFDRLVELRPELVQLALLPYLGFSESQRWANEAAKPE